MSYQSDSIKNMISVCICTYKRPQLLSTLESIDAQENINDYTVEVIVVDNDSELSGKHIVDNFRPQNVIKNITYLSEPMKNIAAARNKTINNAQGELIALIDDDEVAEPNWLYELLSTKQNFNSQVVFGWVKTIYPDHTPSWIVNNQLYNEPRFPNGRIANTGASNCTLIERQYLLEHELQFDLAYGTTGAEDADLFYRMHMLGAKLVHSHDAFVVEILADSRMNAEYLIKKALRIGECFTRYRLKHMSFIQRATYLFKVIAKLLVCVVIVGISKLTKSAQTIKWKLKLCDAYGKLKAIFSSKKVEIYK